MLMPQQGSHAHEQHMWHVVKYCGLLYGLQEVAKPANQAFDAIMACD